MREPYLTPELIRVASVEDLTQSGGGSAVADICITVNGGVSVGVGIISGGSCS